LGVFAVDETTRQVLELRRDGLRAENRRIEEKKREQTHAIVSSPTFDPFAGLTPADHEVQSLIRDQDEGIRRIVEVEQRLGRR
jgi:Spy/CpxP family protein refolding chaperone